MTETVSLALVTLGEIAMLGMLAFFLVIVILKQKPANFKITWSKYGSVEVDFDSKAGK